MGRSDLGRGASGMWLKSGKKLCKLVISFSKENNRLTLTSKWKLASILIKLIRQLLSLMLSCHEYTLLLYFCV